MFQKSSLELLRVLMITETYKDIYNILSNDAAKSFDEKQIVYQKEQSAV